MISEKRSPLPGRVAALARGAALRDGDFRVAGGRFVLDVRVRDADPDPPLVRDPTPSRPRTEPAARSSGVRSVSLAPITTRLRGPERPEEPYLRFEDDIMLFLYGVSHDRDERGHILCRRVTRVHDEVGVYIRDAGTADRRSFQSR